MSHRQLLLVVPLLALAMSGTPVAAQAPTQCPDHAAHMAAVASGTPESRHKHELDARGDAFMGFDQQATVHRFRLAPEGGSIEVTVRDPRDERSRDAVRRHLRQVAAAFAAGDFGIPAAVHARQPPGVDGMRAAAGAVSYAFEELADGGRIAIRATTPIVVAAVHDFLRFQITDHQTGDPLDVPAAAACASVGGSEAVLQAGQTLVLGELHGTRESPAFATALACSALQKGLAVTLALELPREEQKAVDDYLAAADEATAHAGLRQQPSWKDAMQFGITSAARLELLDWLRAQRRAGAALRVVLFDIAPAAQRGAADRERRMAEALVAARRAAPTDLLLVLVGNLHARRTAGTPFDPRLEPMALLMARALPSSPLLTFDASYPAGEAWICQPEPSGCGAVRVRGDGAPGAGFELVVRKTAEGAYDGIYRLPSLTVSPPAFTS